MRPSSYTEKVLKDARKYLKEYDGIVPSIAGLSVFIGRSRATVNNWANDDDKHEFLDILDKIKQIQELKLVDGGLSGNFNSVVTKMMLTKHGYSDRIENSVSNQDGKAFKTDNKWQVEFINAGDEDD